MFTLFSILQLMLLRWLLISLVSLLGPRQRHESHDTFSVFVFAHVSSTVILIFFILFFFLSGSGKLSIISLRYSLLQLIQLRGMGVFAHITNRPRRINAYTENTSASLNLAA